MVVVIIVCAIVGDSVGYEVGKVLGPWLVEHRPLRGKAGVRRVRTSWPAEAGRRCSWGDGWRWPARSCPGWPA